MLMSFDGAVICVTHDRWFLNRIATSILSFEGDGRVVQYAGHYEDYRSQRASMDAARAAKIGPGLIRADKEAPGLVSGVASGAKARRGLTLGEEKELSGLPARIDAAEREVAMLESELNDPILYAQRRAEVASLQGRLDAARSALEELMARWEVLEGKKGS
jgi:ATP-binding cassette subfamily F protein uup